MKFHFNHVIRRYKLRGNFNTSTQYLWVVNFSGISGQGMTMSLDIMKSWESKRECTFSLYFQGTL